MNFLIELILDLLFEGSILISTNKKYPKIVRYPLIALIVLICIAVIGLFFLLGLLVLKENLIIGYGIITLGFILLIMGIKKFKCVYLSKKNNSHIEE